MKPLETASVVLYYGPAEVRGRTVVGVINTFSRCALIAFRTVYNVRDLALTFNAQHIEIDGANGRVTFSVGGTSVYRVETFCYHTLEESVTEYEE